MNALFGGIEGGASNSRIILLDAEGRKLGFAEGPPTNQWLCGIQETVQRLLNLIELGLKDAGLPAGTPISHLCMSLSGVDIEETQQLLISNLRAIRPNVAHTIRICNDTLGGFLTATDGPAIVLVSGTGSICKYIREDLSFVRVGGHGHLLGDGGSAYHIAHHTICKYLEIEDGLIPWAHRTDKVRTLIFDYFGVDNSLGLLNCFLSTFDKGTIAGLCQHLSAAARENEPLCKESFFLAGIQLGRHVRACLRHSIKELGLSAGEITVVCCGNVFRSWDLLQKGFRDVFLECGPFFRWRGTLHLVWLQLTAGYGAARLAARLDAGISIPLPSRAVSTLDRVEIDSFDSL